ncbi:MAG: YihY/virulence factor BrkB family protein [Chitinophagales bacterium]
MKNKFIFLIKVLRESLNNFLNDNVPRLGAALSFYTILSLPPLLMLITGIIGAFFGEQTVKGKIDQQLVELMGAQVAHVITSVSQNVVMKGKGIPFIAFLGAILSATGVFVALQDAFNTIWKVHPKSGTENAVVRFLKTRLMSLSIIVMLGLLVIVGMISSTALAIFSDYLYEYLSAFAYYILHITNVLVSYASYILIFAAIFKFIPDVVLKWKHVWVGAIITTILFSIGRYVLSLYLSTSDISSTYGVAGSLVILLLWIFYSSQILFFGAEFTKIWNEEKKQDIPAKYYAVKVRIEETKIEE